jgi:hypothetical protein
MSVNIELIDVYIIAEIIKENITLKERVKDLEEKLKKEEKEDPVYL